MKIYGQEHDYYDCALAFGQDPVCKWTRKFNRFRVEDFKMPSGMFSENYRDAGELSKPFYFYINSKDSRMLLSLGYVFFCGKTYPVIKLNLWCDNYKHFYSFESFENYLISTAGYNDQEILGSSYGFRNNVADVLKKFMNQDWCCDALHRVNNVAVYTMFGNTIYEGGSLKAVEFVKVFDPYTCLQEIEMYLSGKLGGQSPKILEVEDKYRLEAKGFDKKISFRHRK